MELQPVETSAVRPQLWRKIAQASAIVSLGIALGRVSGLVREIVLFRQLGLSRAADIAVQVLAFPDLLSNILAGAAVGAALMPLMQRAREVAGETAALGVFLRASVALGCASMAISVVCVLLAPQLAFAVAPGFDAQQRSLLGGLLAGSALQFPLAVLATVTTAWLQGCQRFALPATGTLLVNSALTIALLSCVRPSRLGPLVAALLAGALVRWLVQLVPVLKANWGRLRAAWREQRGLAHTLMLAYPAALAAQGLMFLNPVIARALASGMGAGDVAALNYTMKLVELPQGMLLSVLSVALFPILCKELACGREELANKLLRQCVWITWLLSLAVVILMSAFSAEIVRVCFGLGGPGGPALARIATLVVLAALALPAKGMASELIVYLYARRDLTSPFLLSALLVGLYGVLGFLLRHLLSLQGLVILGVAIDWGVLIGLLTLLHRRHRVLVLAPGLTSDGLRAAAGIALGFVPFLPAALGATPASLRWISMAAAGPAMLVSACVPKYQILGGRPKLSRVRSLLRATP